MDYIVHSSIDENKQWGMVLRCHDSDIASQAVQIAIKLENSGLVESDQSQRNTLYDELEKNGWDVDKYIESEVNTECDCSSFVYACYCCVIPQLRGMKNAPTTLTARNFYINAGFEVYTSAQYTQSTNRLKDGDLLNKVGSHIAIYADDKLTTKSETSETPNLNEGSIDESEVIS